MLKFSNEINGMNINTNKKQSAATFLDEFKTMKSSYFFFIIFFAVPFFFFFNINRATKTFSAVYTVAIGINQHQYMRKYNILRLSAANKRSVFVTCTVLECQLNCGATFNW